MPTNYHEEITKLLDSAGLIDKELSVGCLLYSNEYQTYNHFIRENSDGKIETVGDMYPTLEFWDKQELEIIGHDWDLREVMAWFVGKRRETTVMYSMPEISISGEVRLDGEEYLNFVTVNIDLSKPLSQQDLKPLWELMKSISDNK